MARKYPVFPNKKAVHNLTDINLNILQLSALSKVGKFAVPPPKVPRLDIIIAAEKCISRYFDKFTDHNGFRAIIANAINRSSCNFSPNLNPYEYRFIKEIANDSSIKVTNADKGGGVVFMLSSDYHSMALNHLSNTEVYEKDKYTINMYNQRIIDNLNWACKNRKLADVYVRKGTVKFPRFPSIHFLPKTHKEKVNGIFKARPIINTKGSPLQGISNIIFSVLRTFAEQIPYCAKNGSQVLSQLREVDFQNKQIYSLDVNAMFTSLNYAIIKPAVRECLTLNQDILLHKFDMLPEHLDFLIFTLLTQQFFVYKGKHYKQIEGLFMGLAASGPIADVTMAFIERRMFTLVPDIAFYTRYVDDTLIVCDESAMQVIFDFLNSFHKSIKFDIEHGTGRKINFLDICLRIDHLNRLHSSVYRKPTTANRYINYESFSPKSHKTNTVDFMFRRAFAYCSNLCSLKDEINLCIGILLGHNYPYPFLVSRLKAINIKFNFTDLGKYRQGDLSVYGDVFRAPNFTNDLIWKNVNFRGTKINELKEHIPFEYSTKNGHLRIWDGHTIDITNVTLRNNRNPRSGPSNLNRFLSFPIADCHNDSICNQYDATLLPDAHFGQALECNSFSDASDSVMEDSPMSVKQSGSEDDLSVNIESSSSECTIGNDSSCVLSDNEIDVDSSISEGLDAYDFHSSDDSTSSEETVNNDIAVSACNFALFPFFPPIIRTLKKHLLPLGIRPTFVSTHKLRVREKMANPDCIVYMIPCHDCTKSYVGQTRFTLPKRLGEHRKAYEAMDPNGSAVVRHYLAEKHAPDFAAARHIMRIDNLRSREIAEAFHILDRCAYNCATVGRSILHYFKINDGAAST